MRSDSLGYENGIFKSVLTSDGGENQLPGDRELRGLWAEIVLPVPVLLCSVLL